MTNWVKFTGEGEQEYNGEILARVNGVGGVYLLGGDENTGDVVLLGSFDGPVDSDPHMFGGRFTGPSAYIEALNHVVKEVETDIS